MIIQAEKKAYHPTDNFIQMERQLEVKKLNQITPIIYPLHKSKSTSKEHETIDKNYLWLIFKQYFKIISGRAFKETKESINNISAVFYYFLRDESFNYHPNVKMELSKPSFDKGLLIIGDYGIGKTDCMKALELCLKQIKKNRFKIYSTNEIVQKFEICTSSFDKQNFYNQMKLGTDLYDDLTTERLASNFGRVNIMKEIFEERYNHRKLTHAIANYHEEYKNDVEAALENLGTFYGNRFYDRIFEMFNIVVFTGKSMRR
ncbi:hypothetical protein JQC67_03325 [Aurantibacter crassamenti]|uniref:hypothetical protein n=1 Tax=Aurantibacter crassamenti TaxID=1837375 RepID=UPI00193A3E4C|nr:hypothetical protein [Aurantibacter crassamenti]MBM1105164.1 hypothetical protein [Aurantibacter crassamenti]